MYSADHMNRCRCPHHKLFALFLVLIGLTFLLGELAVLSSHVVNIIWPSLLILAGLQKMTDRWCKCCKDEGKAQ